MATIANTVRWADNTAELQRNLAEGLDQIEAITKSANKMARSLNTDAISAGHKWAAAVTKIGGVTKLTTDEKNRMHAALSKTLEKYQALGQAAPTALLRMHEQTKPVVQQTTMVEKATDFLRGSVVRLAAAFSIGNLIERGVSTLFAWGKQAIQAAGDVKDLAERTGLTTDTIQRMSYVAKDTGTSVESFTRAAFKLSVNLSGGAGSVQEAVSDLGLSFQDLRRMGPDEQFATIMRALGGVTNEADRARIGNDLFGRAFMDLMPAVVQGYDQLAAGARVASKEQLDAADRASEAWGRFVENTKATITSWLGNVVIGAGQVWGTMKVGIAGMVGGMGAARAELVELTRQQREGLDGVEKSTKQATVVNIDYVRQLAQARSEVSALTAQKRTQIEAAQKLGATTEELTAQFGISEGALKVLNETTKTTVKTESEAAREAKRLRDELRGIADTLTGRKVAGEVEKANQAIALLTNAERNDPEVIARIAKRASELSAQGAQLSGALLDVWISQRAWWDGMPRVEQGLEGITNRTRDLTNELGRLALVPKPLPIATNPLDVLDTIHNIAPSVELAPPPKDKLLSFGDFFKNDLAGTIMGAFQGGGDALKSIGGSIGGFLTSSTSAVGKAISGGLTSLLGKGVGGALGSVLPGVGTLIGGFLGDKLGGLFGGLFGKSKNAILDEEATKQIKTLQAELLKTHGSMANLSRMGKIVGLDFESAWGSRSQQGLKEFSALVEEFQEKQERLQGALDRYGLTWMDLGEEARAAHLDQVADGLLADFEILQTAGADVTRIVAGMSGGINQFLTDTLRAGAAIPPAMQPMIEQLIRTGQLTEENAALMLGLQHEAPPAWADITAAAERYGIAVDKLGPKITQIRIAEEAAQVVKDFDLLVGAGANVGAVMAGMQKKVQGLVSDALRLGLELPASMRPMLEQMVKAGLLTDDTGKKLTSLAGLKFAEPLSAAVDRLLAKLDELIKAIAGGDGVAGAIRDVNGRTFTIKGKVDWDNVQTGANVPTAHTGALVSLTGVQKHHQGTARILKFHSGIASLASDEVPAILQVGESVLNRRATQAIGPEAIRALNQGRVSGGGGVTRIDVRTDALERELAALRQDVRDQADRTYRAIRDAVQQGAA